MLTLNNRIGHLEFVPVVSALFRGTLTVGFFLFVAANSFAQVRVLDLGTVTPEEFATQSSHSLEPRKFPENFVLPPIPVTDLSEIETAESLGTFSDTVNQCKINLTAFLPPEPEQLAPSPYELENAPEVYVELTEEVEQTVDDTISQLAGHYCVPESEVEVVENVNYSEMPIIATHKLLGACYRCTQFMPSSSRRNWIFWRSECREKQPGPICCAMQQRSVNWRHSAAHLKGCLPEGYNLRCFIESVHHVEFHDSTLAADGPIDAGGSFEDAKKIEGAETKPIQQVSIDITPPKGELPGDRAKEKFKQLPVQLHMPGTHRLWCGTSFYWQASLLNHQPLYFEDVNLERHGFSRGYLQPLISGAKFFGTLPALPYLMAANPPHETSFTLGQSRPGSHACFVSERPRLQLDAAAVEAAAVVGLVFLIP